MAELLHGEYKVPGGKLVAVDLHVDEGHLTDVRVSGDFFLDPDEVRTAFLRLKGRPGVLAAAITSTVSAPLSTVLMRWL